MKLSSPQLLGSRLQRLISSEIDDGVVGVSVHVPHAFVVSGRTHQCIDSSNTGPLCYYSAVIVSSDKHIFPHICPIVIRLRHFLFSAPFSTRRAFFVFFQYPAMRALQNPRLAYPYCSPRFLISSKSTHFKHISYTSRISI
jgi:hypothetical protein